MPTLVIGKYPLVPALWVKHVLLVSFRFLSQHCVIRIVSKADREYFDGNLLNSPFI